MEALRWLQELMDMVIKWIPKPIIVLSTEGAVAFVRGRPRPAVTGKWIWVWPIWTEVYSVPTTYQPMPMPSQSVIVRHGKTMKTLGVDGRIEYQVIDAFEVLTKEYDVDGIVEAEVCHAVRGALWGQQLNDIIHDADVLCENAVAKANEELVPRGIKVRALRLSVMAECKVIQVMGLEKQAGKIIIPLTGEEA